MNLVEIFEWVKMATVFGIILIFVFCGVALFFGRGEYSDKVVYPWEKEERRAAKKAAKEERRACKRKQAVGKQ